MQTLRARCSLLVILLLAAAPSEAGQRGVVSARPKLDFTPFTGPWKDRAELIPVLAGDLVFATTTLRVLAFDSCSTDLRWSAGPPDGWDELEPDVRAGLFDGLGRRLCVEPAVGESVVVAALQVPMSRRKNLEWQGITIRTALPERRLFAFELGTGRPLWNHSPLPGWTGDGGSHAQRMSLVGSPTVVGQHVIAASSSDESSIDYHVSCYQLATGSLIWTTFVVRGQIERNGYGYLPCEFSAAPLVAVPERGLVLAQTGLGLIAALDSATGEIQWRTEYQAIELPKARSYSPPRRETVWRMSPPIVVGDVVLATPPDSRHLFAFDLADGHKLWWVWARGLAELDSGTKLLAFDDLIGADEQVIYLGGSKISALMKNGGLRSPKSFEPLWTERVERPDLAGRCQLAGDDLLLPGPGRCLVLERENGKKKSEQILDGTPRGLLVTDAAIFALTDDGLNRIER